MTQPNFYVPALADIASVSASNPAVVTTSADHGYLPGIQVRFMAPQNVGRPELNGNVFEATILSPTTFSVASSTSDTGGFVGDPLDPSFVIPVGEVATTLANAVHNNHNIVPESSWITR